MNTAATSIKVRPTPEDFLSFNRGIFKIGNETSLLDKQGTEAFFSDFYKQVQSVATVEEVKDIVVDAQLEKIYDMNTMDIKDYDTKTKLRALFVSVMIQKVVAIKFANDPDFFSKADKELSSLWGKFGDFNEGDRRSLRDFYIVLREAKFWQIQKKWEKFAFRSSSLAVNEGIWYCPGGGATLPTRNRLELFKTFEDQFVKPEDGEKKTVEKKRKNVSSNTSGELDAVAPKRRVKVKSSSTRTPQAGTTPASLGIVEGSYDEYGDEESYDEDREGEWCKVADGAGYSDSESSTEEVAEYIYKNEEALHPSFTRYNFADTNGSSDLLSYTHIKKLNSDK